MFEQHRELTYAHYPDTPVAMFSPTCFMLYKYYVHFTSKPFEGSIQTCPPFHEDFSVYFLRTRIFSLLTTVRLKNLRLVKSAADTPIFFV